MAVRPGRRDGGPTLERLRVPDEEASAVQVLGHGAAAAPAVADLLEPLRAALSPDPRSP